MEENSNRDSKNGITDLHQHITSDIKTAALGT